MPPFLFLGILLVGVYTDRARARIRDTLRDDRGASTLEMVIIALGLLTVAGILVAAITAAVKSRADQLQ